MYAKCITDGGERRFVISDFFANQHWMFTGKKQEKISKTEAELFWKKY